MVATANAGTERGAGDAFARSGHRAADYLDVAAGLPPAAADAGSVRIAAEALRHERAFAVDGHGRDIARPIA